MQSELKRVAGKLADPNPCANLTHARPECTSPTPTFFLTLSSHGTLQVNGSMFLCHLKEGGREWRMQGPIPAALSTGPHPKLTAALPTVVLPASTDMTPPAPSAGGGAAFTATHSAASAAEGEGQQGAHASASAAGKKGQQGGDASASAAGGEGQQVVAAPGSASSSSSSTWVMCNGSSTCMVTADDAGAGHITEAGSAGYGA
eukprot:scaffold152678_cov15-Tisochrysis_lutea.AAC.1